VTQQNERSSWVTVLICILAMAVLGTACAGLGGWLGAPAGQGAKEQDSTGAEQVTFKIPGGGLLTMPVAPSAKTTWHVPGVGDVTIDPATAGAPKPAAAGSSAPSSTSEPSPGATQPSAPQGPTNADAIGDAGGGVVGMFTGNPLLGILAATALKELLGKLIPAKKKDEPELSPA
jgi:hypothetical protein